MGLVHLHRHSEFSRLDGVGTAQQYAQRAAEMGQPGLGLTDHATLSGLLHHMVACKGKDDKGNKIHEPIIPICGVEAYYRPDRTIREKENLKQWHLCFWAKNLKGWHNLLRLTSIAFRDNDDGVGGFYQKPCVDLRLMEEHSEGVIVSTACISGWLSHCILNGDDKGALKWISELHRIYGDDVYLEIMPHDFDDQRIANIETANLSIETSTALLTGIDAHVPFKEWASTQQIAKMLATKSSFKKTAALRKKLEAKGQDGSNFGEMIPTIYLMEEEEVLDLYDLAHPNLPDDWVKESIDNTELVMKSCMPYKLSKQLKFPRVSESPEAADEELRAWCEEGLERISQYDPFKEWEGTKEDLEDEWRSRLEFEYDTIRNKGVIDYFILVGKWVRWMKEQKIRVTCRGSAAGCFVSYLIGISPIDPIAYGLLFERFLNPGRKGLPDIDIDIQSDRRDEAIAWLIKEHGENHVAQIIAHGTFQAKKVLVDVARVYDIPSKEVEPVRKSIDIGQEDDETTLEQLRPINENLQKFADDHPEVYAQALRLEGMVATASQHAAGVVITDKPITDYMPLERGKKGNQVTSWSDRADFPAVSEYGFVKLDALGVKGLSKQDIAVKLIKERHGVDLDLPNLEVMRDPHAVDPKVMDIFTKGLTLGVWQFGSRGITNLVKGIKPTWVGDLIAANALYRPGAMGSGTTWEYSERKDLDESEIDYWAEEVYPITAETFGLIAYQEQVMNICKVIGGFSPGQADDMRKAMGKLYRLPGSAAKEFMQGFKDTWDAGVKSIGLDVRVAEQIWSYIISFGGYGFNKSHSACYAVQAYQDAYLKCYYPAEFYVGLLTYPPAIKKTEEKAKFLQRVVREASAVDVEVGLPDINKSKAHFTLDGNKLVFGLLDIKDVGVAAVDQITEYRPFWNWGDFEQRVEAKNCNATVKRALVQSGACDRWNMRDEMSANVMAMHEKERLGFSLTTTGDTEKHREEIEENVWTVDEFDEAGEDEEIVVGGDVIDIKMLVTKKGKNPGQDMAKVTLAIGAQQWGVTFFPGMWETHKKRIEEGAIMVSGRKNTWNHESSVVAQHVKTIEEWVEDLESEEALLEPVA